MIRDRHGNPTTYELAMARWRFLAGAWLHFARQREIVSLSAAMRARISPFPWPEEVN